MNGSFKKWLELAKEGKDVTLISFLNDLSEIEKANLFHSNNKLLFGTAGIRAKVGIGSALLNDYNVFRIGLAYANSLTKENLEKGIIILHDTRIHSDTFSEVFLKALTHSGIKKIYVYKNNHPAITPMISFFIRKMNLGSGVMITASHNPPEYQGIKFYNNKGIQISDKTAKIIEDKLNNIELVSFSHIKRVKAISIPLKYEIQYFDMLERLYKTNHVKAGGKVKVLVTTLQGASAPFVEKLKKRLHLDISLVESEKEPDGRFSFAQSTNPENFDKAYNNALKDIDNDDYDLLVAIDPDGDRLGVVDLVELRRVIESTTEPETLNSNTLMNKTQEWCISGNKVAALLLDQVLYAKMATKKQNKFKGAVVRSYVTSDFVDIIAKKHGLEVYEDFTGFKWIGGKAEIISQKMPIFLAFEESIGYFFANDAREKDSLQALVVLITLMERLKKNNLSLVDHLNYLYRTYKMYVDETDNIYVKITYQQFLDIILDIENSSIVKKGYIKIKRIYDPFDPEKVNLVKLMLQDKSGWIALRPSGTEPKIKTYYIINGLNLKKIKQKIAFYKKEIGQIIEDFTDRINK